MKKLLLVTCIILISNSALAHGEDKPGPNGGFIRMPGAFHTELLPVGKNKLKAYLLDIQWKNPSVRQSNLEIIYSGKSVINAKCEIKENYYLCEFPKTVDLTKKGELRVLAQREEQQGMEVSYPLPFKLAVADGGHGTHH